MKRKAQPAKFDRCVKAVKKKGGVVSPYAVCARTRNAALPYPGALKLASPDATPKAIAAAKRGLRSGQFGSLPRRKNPADKAAEAFREFTGRDSTETIKVTKQIHFHHHLFEVGKLR